MVKFIASCGFVGYFPFAPGSWVSLLVLILIWFGRPSLPLFSIFILLSFFGGVIIASSAERIWEHDSGKIVIDELLGMLVALFLLPHKLLYYALSLILFRFFDIVKPLFIRKFEKLPSGWGVMADDLLAGIYANLVVQILVLILR
ncbi:MAG TPA: phosphatidylglycerophosphatase A [candidate division Zixibacteria bacterium]|nr:phosphatidylglycerophosphatase A [candidate division Zixibacteria bacterium]